MTYIEAKQQLAYLRDQTKYEEETDTKEITVAVLDVLEYLVDVAHGIFTVVRPS